MGNFISFLAVVAFLVLGGIVLMGTQQRMHETSQGVADDEYAVLATNVAVSGAERAKQHLTRSFTGASFEGNFEEGTYDVDITISGSTATIISEGTVLTSDGDIAKKTVRIVVEPAPEPVPGSFASGLLVDGDLTIGGHGDILSIGVSDSTALTMNANVHTNSRLQVIGSAARVAGFGSYSGSLLGGHAGTVFQPNYNPDGNPSIASAPRLDFPSIDPVQMGIDLGIDVNISTDMPDSWNESATLPARYNCELTGTLEGGSSTNPRVVYCPGHLRMDDLLIEGYAIIISKGYTEIDGLVHTDVSTYPDGETSSLAIYSGNDIIMNGGDVVWAQLFTNGTLQYLGNVDIYGSLITKGALVLSGNADIHYRPAHIALVAPRERNPRLLMVAYSEE